MNRPRIAVTMDGRQLAKAAKCDHCHRRYRKGAKDAALWNVTFDHGVIVGFTCPDCQTTEQSLEADVNAALLDYKRITLTPDGRAYAPYKTTEAAE